MPEWYLDDVRIFDLGQDNLWAWIWLPCMPTADELISDVAMSISWFKTFYYHPLLLLRLVSLHWLSLCCWATTTMICQSTIQWMVASHCDCCCHAQPLFVSTGFSILAELCLPELWCCCRPLVLLRSSAGLLRLAAVYWKCAVTICFNCALTVYCSCTI